MVKLGFKFLFFIGVFVCTACKSSKEENLQPNIILIMTDDMGYSDIGCYGGPIKTPVLDGLAANGLRFTQFYNTGRCCPTRASLLTGLYSHQAGIGHMTGNLGREGYSGDLSRNAVTIAEVLKGVGYSTYMSGKWHITPADLPNTNPPKHNWPLQRGFDKFFGTITGAGSFYDPVTLAYNNEYIYPKEDFYYTDAISDKAVEFIEDHKSNRPFFIYMAYTGAHWPMHAKPEDIAKYKGQFDAGWDKLRQEKYQRMLEMGLVKPEWVLSEEDGIPDWEEVELKDWYSSLMEVYAAMIDCIDQGIGRIMNSLEKKGIIENTLVLFLQDNGGCAEEFGFSDIIQPFHKDVDMAELKPMENDEIQKDYVPKYTRDGRPVLIGKGLQPGSENTYLGYGKSWANTSNTPFRMYKHWVHEGGISTPLIVHWPDGIKAKSEFRNQPAHVIDIMATCIDVAEADYPRIFKENSIIEMEGVSLRPAFDNFNLPERIICWEHEGNKAIRKGKYKLVSKWEQDAEFDWELYDLESDRSETINLATQMPEKVNKLEALWITWAKKSGVVTWSEKLLIE
ncbi:arylsulfatase [Membranihabitans maritimus]|uniref:arylsulfatase n=1 Tax=Membranihabitans maritimus TaxID=2904244 RepID=UPI002104DCEF|nr:arylsulfatase [Membranihabitans maritimus]